MSLAAWAQGFEGATWAVEAATDVFGGVFGLVNNASIFSTLQMRPFWEIPAEEWDTVRRNVGRFEEVQKSPGGILRL